MKKIFLIFLVIFILPRIYTQNYEQNGGYLVKVTRDTLFDGTKESLVLNEKQIKELEQNGHTEYLQPTKKMKSFPYCFFEYEDFPERKFIIQVTEGKKLNYVEIPGLKKEGKHFELIISFLTLLLTMSIPFFSLRKTYRKNVNFKGGLISGESTVWSWLFTGFILIVLFIVANLLGFVYYDIYPGSTSWSWFIVILSLGCLTLLLALWRLRVIKRYHQKRFANAVH